MSSGPSRWQIARAVPGGSRRARDQLTWLREVLALIDEQPWYACRKASTAEVARILARYMDWQSRTCRPGHEHVAVAAGVSVRTVSRIVAWLAAEGFLGTVSPGSTPMLSPGVLHGLSDRPEANSAAVYVLCAPRKTPACRARDRASGEFGDLSCTRRVLDKAPHVRARRPGVTPPARAPRGLSPQTSAPCSWRLSDRPETRTEARAAAIALQDHSPVLRSLSPEHLRSLARPYVLAGWTPGDVAHALAHHPAGRAYGYRHEPRHVAGWVRWRLGQWLGPDGAPLPSASQRRAAAEADRVAQASWAAAQAASRRDNASRHQGAASRGAELARELLARARRNTGAPPPAAGPARDTEATHGEEVARLATSECRHGQAGQEVESGSTS